MVSKTYFATIFLTHGSGVYMGLELCLIYCVEWKTRKARPARKSREDNKPATGRNWKPVQSVSMEYTYNYVLAVRIVQGI